LNTIACIILAAGASTRMGKPKQLLPYQGCSLLRRITKRAIASVCEPVIVVLGAYAEVTHTEVNNLPVLRVENTSWMEGMGSSIRAGIEALQTYPEDIEAVIILLCDQPFVSEEVINQLVTMYESTGKSIIACEYADTIGVPALFQHRHFGELCSLKQAEGAKKIINKYIQEIECISFPQGAVDIDTKEDYQFLTL